MRRAAIVGAIFVWAFNGPGAAVAMSAKVHAPSTTGKPTPRAAVAAAVEASGPCFQIDFTATARCPITNRMDGRVKTLVAYDRKHFRTGPPNFFCRCQGGTTTILSTVVETNRRATVRTAMGNTNHLTFVLVKQKSGWLIDDQHCTKPPAADIYRTTVPPSCK